LLEIFLLFLQSKEMFFHPVSSHSISLPNTNKSQKRTFNINLRHILFVIKKRDCPKFQTIENKTGPKKKKKHDFSQKFVKQFFLKIRQFGTEFFFVGFNILRLNFCLIKITGSHL
jgi:hypothetical protein